MIRRADLFDRRHLRGDLAGGLTTAVVSLPLALAFGVASGAGPQAGLYGAILVGFWAALLGGTSTLISEPTGPMTLMMTVVFTQISATHPEEALAIGAAVVILAGAFQIVFGLLDMGRYITLMPYSVISGFMSGIGILLVVQQVGPLLGHPSPPGGTLAVIRALPDMVSAIRWPEFVLGAACLTVLVAYPPAWVRRAPPRLLVLAGGTLLTWAFFGPGELRVIGEMPRGIPLPRMPLITPDLVGRILVDSLLLALLGSIDTLLTAMIADSLTRTEHNSRRELIGQGIANVLSGWMGGLPGAGATTGTVVNIQAGAGTPRAGLIRALVLFAAMWVAAPLLRGVPLVVLAAITAKVGIDILDWSFLRRAHRVSPTATGIMYGVMFLAVTVDIMVAVGIGVFIANLVTIERLSRLHGSQVRMIDPASDIDLPMSPEEKELLDRGQGRIVIFHLSGPMIFGVAKAIAREHGAIRQARVLIVDLSDVPILATTVGLAIENVIRDAQALGCAVLVAGAGQSLRDRLEGLGLIGRDSGTELLDTRSVALRRAVDILAARP